mmetsp:Transcript_13502/g.29229  ORF Transcript_13502/g.29229 Transcript_13502/m.29229 type:complete len:146 (-) Transcript_13502:132-569(-)
MIVAQVEYVKAPLAPNPLRIAICHAGADVLMRACYKPAIYSYAITAHDSSGEQLGADRGDVVAHHIAGPLCFAGDYLKKDLPLRPLHPGDFLVVHDVGANSLSLWSRHCSRLVPPVYVFERIDGGVRVTRRKEVETLDRLLDFWR